MSLFLPARQGRQAVLLQKGMLLLPPQPGVPCEQSGIQRSHSFSLRSLAWLSQVESKGAWSQGHTLPGAPGTNVAREVTLMGEGGAKVEIKSRK